MVVHFCSFMSGTSCPWCPLKVQEIKKHVFCPPPNLIHLYNLLKRGHLGRFSGFPPGTCAGTASAERCLTPNMNLASNRKCFLTFHSMQNYIPNSMNLTGIFHFFFSFFHFNTQYIPTKLTASELKRGWPEWAVSSFGHSSHSHISRPSVLPPTRKNPGQEFCLLGPEQNELLLKNPGPVA